MVKGIKKYTKVLLPSISILSIFCNSLKEFSEVNLVKFLFKVLSINIKLNSEFLLTNFTPIFSWLYTLKTVYLTYFEKNKSIEFLPIK